MKFSRRGFYFRVMVFFLSGAMVLCESAPAMAAAAIDVHVLDAPWPNQHERSIEVGRDTVQWRAARTQSEVYAGVQFVMPVPLEIAWEETTDYEDLTDITPGVKSVNVVEESENYQKIELVIEVLWLTLTMNFELEREPKEWIRFRLVSPELGEYIGEMTTKALSEEAVEVELNTWLKPAGQVSTRLILIAERMVLLGSIEEFIETCREMALAESNS